MTIYFTNNKTLETKVNDSRISSVAVAKMDEQTINKSLKNVKNYLGSFAVDELDEIKVNFYPSFTVVNLGFPRLA